MKDSYRPLRTHIDVGRSAAKPAGMDIDWNPIVHILDELSEGTHSLLELSYSQCHYDGSAYLDALLFLADRKLIELSQGIEQLETVPSEQWGQRLREAFEGDATASHPHQRKPQST